MMKCVSALATTRSLLLALLAGVSTHAVSSAAHAQTASVATDARQSISFDIAPQPLSSALVEFARQSGLRTLFSYDQLGSVRTSGVRGTYTREEALTRLLSNSGYTGQIGADNVLTLEGAGRPQRASADDPADLAPQQVTDNEAEETSTPNHASAQTDDEEIVVTGSRIRGAPPAGANLIGIDRDEIEQTGRTTLQDVLQTLPQVFPGSQGELTQLNSTAPGRNIALGSTVDLRGLGSDATLTLVNGRRLAPAGLGNFVDISAIPIAAIERVEVLADGASATYGADAVGGVVNIILRRDLDAAETSARYGFADGGMGELGVSHVLGETWRGGSLIAGYEYRSRDALAASERDYAANSDLRPFGGTNFSRNTSNPGNIIRVGATPVTLAIPAGQNGLTLTQGQLLAGQINFQNSLEGAFLLPEQQSHALFGSARQQVNERVALFFDLLASQREAHAEKAQLGGVVSVPESNYYRQQNGLFSGQGPLFMAYFFGDDLGPLMVDTNSRTLTAAGGATFDLFADWRLEASLAYGLHVDHVDNTNIADSAAIAAALASSDPTLALNPFGEGSNSAASALAALTMRQELESDSELATYALRADGGLFDLPGGRARMAFGLERRRETFSIDRTEQRASGIVTHPAIQAPGERTTDAIYAELFLPLLDERAHLPLVNALTLSLSARREQSSDFGSATTPKIGVQWELTPDFAVRATWGTSFKAPQFTQMLGGTGATIGAIPALFDPNATNGSTGTLQIVGSNRNLEPEEAETWTAGFDVHPSWAVGFRFSATYFDITFANRIANPGSLLDAFRTPSQYQGYFITNPTPQQVADYLALADTVSGVVPPDGIEVIWDERLTNLAALRVRGIDLSASYSFDAGFGDVSLFASASGLLQFARQNNPALASVDLLDTVSNPIDWRGRAGVAINTDAWRGALTVNYADSYTDTFSTPKREIDSWITYDARLTRRFGAAEGPSTELSLDIRNLTDEDPPFVNNPIGMAFDTLNASPVGRVIMLEARHRW